MNLYEKQKKHTNYGDFISTWEYPKSLADGCIYSLVNCGRENEAKQLNKRYFGKYKKWYPYIAYQSGDLEKAIYYAEENLQSFPDDLHCLQELGKLKMFVGQYEIAKKHLLKTLDIAKRDVNISVHTSSLLTVLYTKLGDLEKSKKMQEEALTIDSIETWTELSILYGKVKEWELSLDAAQKVLELLPEEKNTLEELIEGQMMLDMNEEALKNCHHLLEEQPANGKAWIMKAKIHISTREDDNALIALSHALDSKNLTRALTTEASELQSKLKREKVIKC